MGHRISCTLCSYGHDDENTESLKWDDLPAEWVCPVCGSPKSLFSVVKVVAPSAPALPSARPCGQLPMWPLFVPL
ncbi:MAG: rubredoxin [Desulfuromonas sp.]|nr:rubredoxin [Desulfuromonas sp.]